jgi:hypothetical protein
VTEYPKLPMTTESKVSDERLDELIFKEDDVRHIPHGMCEHYACRCARANELAIMAGRTGQTRLLVEAIRVHDQVVVCRAVNRKEPI